MIEYFDKEEFMKAPVELRSVTETQNVLGPRGNVIMPLIQEQSVVLHIGDRDYDVRDLVYRLLRAEGEVAMLMDKVADLQTHVRVLEDKMSAREPEIDNNSKLLDDFLKGEWKIRID